MSQAKKLRLGWFSFTCCEDSTIMFTELMNEHFFEWKKLIDFRHARVLKAEKIRRLDEIVPVDAIVPGCPMDTDKFLKLLNQLLIEFDITPITSPLTTNG